jgi:hypothetical protein
MSSPTSEPAREPHVEQTSPPQVGLFSHTPTAELINQHQPADRTDWRSAPFSPAQGRGAAADEQAEPGVPRRTGKSPAGTAT